MAAYGDARDAAVPEPLNVAWARAVEAWDDPARHDELLRLVAANDCYAWAAGRYRTRSDAVAERQLARLRRAAEATLLVGATMRRDTATRPYAATTGVLAILIALVVIGLIYAAVIHQPPSAPSAPAFPARTLTPGHPVSPSTVNGAQVR